MTPIDPTDVQLVITAAAAASASAGLIGATNAAFGKLKHDAKKMADVAASARVGLGKIPPKPGK